ncbi:MAG: hypothetical protein AAF399_00990 [Bacteroidota bacterium]
MIDHLEDMTHEEIHQLLTENERLKKENEELKVHLSFSSVETINGYNDASELLNDTVFNSLNQRLSLLGQSNAQLKAALTGFEELEKGLSTLLPALEVQLRGWNTEINNLRRSIEHTENTYAGVVSKLEEQVASLRDSQQADKEELQAKHETQIAQLTQQMELLSERLQQTEVAEEGVVAPDDVSEEPENPFRTLSIYPDSP